MKREKSRLSGADAILIAMGINLSKLCRLENTYIVTMDLHLANVCNHNLSTLPRAIYVLQDPIPDG